MPDSPASPLPGAAPSPQELSRLPMVMTSLIARTDEIGTLTRRVLSGTRLTTITGPGGVGKTRVALGVANHLEAQGHRVAFVSLADIADAALVLPVVARALDIQERGASESGLANVIAQHLDAEPCVLVLDNVEHVLEATPAVVDLMQRCPQLVLLVTSRVRLKVPGEQVVPLPPLLPDDAVRLYLERMPGRIAAPREADDLATIREICQRLDCLPLAVELAASWADILSPRATLRRLTNGKAALEDRGGYPGRFRTMAAAIGWSYHLLTPQAQKLFRQLSVFQGGVSEAMAAALWNDLDTGGFSPLAMLAHLTDHQLLTRRDDADGEPRFDMLVTIRDFAREQVHAHDETDACQLRFSTLMLDLVRDVESQLQGPQQHVCLQRLNAEYQNIQAAMAYALDRHDVRGRLMAGAMWRYWLITGALTEGRFWLERACSLQTDDLSTGTYDALRGAGVLAIMQGDHAVAESRLQQAQVVARHTNDVAGLANAATHLGVLEHYRGHLAMAVQYQDEAAGLFQDLGDEAGMIKALSNKGNVLRIQGKLAEARHALETSLRYARGAQDPHGLAAAIENLAGVCFEQQDYAAVLQAATETYEIRHELGDRLGMLASLSNMAAAHAMAGDLEAAISTSYEALPLARAGQDPGTETVLLGNLGDMLRQQGDLAQAATVLGQAHAIASIAGSSLSMPNICRNWARVELELGDRARSLELYQEALRTALPLERPSLVVDCVEGIAVACPDVGVAAALLVWVEHRRAMLGEHLDGQDQQFFDDAVNAVRAKLPAAQWPALVAQALNVPQDDVMDRCLRLNAGAGVVASDDDIEPNGGWGLTGREAEVLALLTSGKTDQEIADALFIARSTASKHVGSVLEKLGVENRASAVALAVKRGISI